MRGSARLAALLVCATVAVGFVAGGCGSDDEQPTPTAAETPDATEDSGGGDQDPGADRAAESTDKIEIADFKYDPEAVTVEAGTEVAWTNGDEAAHTATADDGSFDTGTLNLDDSGNATFDQPGTYSYYCRFHPFMKATVEVQ